MPNIVITGSTRGIGLAMAREFLKAGCQVTLSGRNQDPPASLAIDLAAGGRHCQYVPCDVRDYASVADLWQQAAANWGRVDIWINNAGVNCPFDFCFKTAEEDIDAVLDTNLKGTICGSRIAAARMLDQGGGQIFNMLGMGADGRIQTKTILYGTTKRAVAYFSEGLARELAGTPVLAGRLSPGMMLTDFITKTRQGQDAPVLQDKAFRFIFNALADRPETVAPFLVSRILANRQNGSHVVWLGGLRAMWRLLASLLKQRRLLD